MGLLSGVTKAVTGTIKAVTGTISKVVAPVIKAVMPTQAKISNVGAVLAQSLNPLSKEKPVANVKNPVVKAALEFVAASPYTTAALVAAPVAVGGAVGKAIMAWGTGTKIIAGAGAVYGTAILVTSPKAQETVIRTASSITPESIFKVGGETGGLIEDFSVNAGIEFLKAHPYLTAATAAAALTAAGFGLTKIAAIIAAYYQTSAAKKYLDSDIPKEITAFPDIKEGALVPEKTLKSDEVKPLTNQTATITTGKRRRRKVKAALISPSVRQSVQVVLSNRNIGYQLNKRYINERILAY
jgi:hypothetical protein